MKEGRVSQCPYEIQEPVRSTPPAENGRLSTGGLPSCGCRRLPRPLPERIVSLAPNLTEILYDLGVENRIAAVTDYCDYPPGAGTKPKIGGFVNPSLEAIVSLRPDWVVMTEDGNPQVLERRLRTLGIRTYVFKARRIKDLPQEIRTMGRILGVGTAADRRADWIETRIRRIGEGTDTASRRRVRKAIFIVQPAPLIAAGKGTTIDDAFAILGIDNIAAAGKTRYPKYSLEEIIRLEPDALFFGRGHGVEERSKPLLERLSTLDAVRSGRVFSSVKPSTGSDPESLPGWKRWRPVWTHGEGDAGNCLPADPFASDEKNAERGQQDHPLQGSGEAEDGDEGEAPQDSAEAAADEVRRVEGGR